MSVSFTKPRVTIQLDRLECVREYDESGGSEPYLWPAFIHLDATTLFDPEAQVVVPLANSSARYALGDLGDGIRRGQSVAIPASIGRRVFDLELYQGLGIAGFVVVLLEDDGSPDDDAIRAGHQTFATSLRREVNQYVGEQAATPPEERGLPDEERLEAMKSAIQHDVQDTIEAESDFFWDWFQSNDRLIGFLGSEQTLYTAAQLHEWGGQGPRQMSSAIAGTQTVYVPMGFGFKQVVYEQRYVVHWTVEVEELPRFDQLELEMTEAFEKRVEALRELGNSIATTPTKGAGLPRLTARQRRERAELIRGLRATARALNQYRRDLARQ